MKKFLIIMTTVLLPPLGVILSCKQIKRDERKINQLKDEIDFKNIAIDTLLESKNSNWTDEQKSEFKNRLKEYLKKCNKRSK